MWTFAMYFAIHALPSIKLRSATAPTARALMRRGRLGSARVRHGGDAAKAALLVVRSPLLAGTGLAGLMGWAAMAANAALAARSASRPPYVISLVTSR